MSDTASAALRDIASHHGLREDFPADVLGETARWVADPGIDDPALVDLTHLPFVTIDETTSRDLDQAVCVERHGDDLVVWYAIADAAHFVRPGTALFREALARGASYYLPGLTLPMLPRELSEGLVSLGEGEDRRALVFRVALDPVGQVTRWRMERGRVHSRAKLAWEPVQAFYDGRRCPTAAAGVAASLEALREAGLRRLALAEARHLVRYRRAELSVGVDEGLRFVAVEDLRNDIERYNEQISLLCNTLGARLLRDARPDLVQAIYRVHQPPPDEALADLERQIAALVRAHRLDPQVWAWTPDDLDLAAYLGGLPRTRMALAIHRQAILTNLRSEYQAEPAPHHGVGADVYARFTAPMREIVGVFVHKEALEALAGVPLPAPGAPDDEALRTRVIASANRARQLQRVLDREANGLVLDQLLGDALTQGTAHAGTVMGLTGSKVHVRFDDPPVDVKVYVRHLERHLGRTLRAGDDGVSLRDPRGRAVVRTGDEVRVVVRGRDEERERWELSLI